MTTTPPTTSEPVFGEEDGRRYPILWRDDAEEPSDPCPYCGARHIHGAADGHRSAHCRTPTREERYELEKQSGRGDWFVEDEEGERYFTDRGYIVRTRD